MRKKSKLLFGLVVLTTTLAIFSCSKGGSSYSSSNNNPPPGSSGNAVSIVNMSFSPSTITVSAGTTITWTNNDAMTHTVTADDNSFNSGNIAPGSKFSKVFATAGSFTYHCSIHPGMKGTAVVN